MDPPPDHGEDSYEGSGLLSDLKAVVTGGDSGIGRAVALAYAREGADVLFSHLPDEDKDAVDKLTRINKWYCEQMAYLAKRLAETPEPGGGGSLLDNTTIMWTNELGKGNSHTLDNIPCVMVGGAPVTQEYADAVGADGYAPDASATVKRAKDLLNKRRALVSA